MYFICSRIRYRNTLTLKHTHTHSAARLQYENTEYCATKTTTAFINLLRVSLSSTRVHLPLCCRFLWGNYFLHFISWLLFIGYHWHSCVAEQNIKARTHTRCAFYFSIFRSNFHSYLNESCHTIMHSCPKCSLSNRSGQMRQVRTKELVSHTLTRNRQRPVFVVFFFSGPENGPVNKEMDFVLCVNNGADCAMCAYLSNEW